MRPLVFRATARALALGIAILTCASAVAAGVLAGTVGSHGPAASPLDLTHPGSPPVSDRDAALSAATAPASWAGSTLATLLPNYNASLPGNFRSLVDDWQVGTPATVPGSDIVWWPQIAVAVNGSPAKVAAPMIEFNRSSDAVTGIDPAVSNTSSVAYDPLTDLLYATETYNNSVVAINATDGQPTGVSYPVGSAPIGIVYDTLSHDLFVANSGSSNVSVINPEQQGPTALVWPGIVVGKDPFALADDPTDNWVYVANAGSAYLSRVNSSDPGQTVLSISLYYGAATGIAYSSKTDYLAVTTASAENLTVISGKDGAVVTTMITVGTSCRAIVPYAGGSNFVVANATGATLTEVNASYPFKVNATTISVGDGPAQVESIAGSSLAVVWANDSRTFTAVNLRSGAVGPTSPTLGPQPSLVAYDPDSGNLFAGDAALPGIEVLDPFTGANTSAPMPLASPPTSLAVNAGLGILYVGYDGGVRAYNVTTGSILSQDTVLAGPNGPLVPDPAGAVVWDGRTSQGVAVALNASTLEPTGVSVPVQLPAGASYSLALDPADGLLFGVNSTADKVSEFNASTGVVEGSPIAAGKNVTALLWDPADQVVCAIGDSLEGIDPQTMTVNLSAVTLVSHVHVGGVVYDPSRQAVYIGTWTGTPYSGSLTILNGSDPSAFRASLTVVSTGFEPASLSAIEDLPGGLAASGVIVAANQVSGTISVVGSPPEIDAASFAPEAVDVNATTSLTVVATGGAGASSVSFTGQPVGCAAPTGYTLNCTPTVAGSFDVLVTVTDSLNETATAAAPLTVDDRLAVAADFGLPPSHETDAGLPGTMTATASGGTPTYSYLWDFGDGTTASGASVSHAYAKPGDYVASVTATDDGGGRVVNESVVIVEADPTVQLTASSPTTDVGLTVALQATIDGGAGPGSGTWQFGDGTTSPLASTTHAWTKSGLYAVNYSYTDAVGQTVKQSLNVLVNPVLTGQFSAVPLTANPTVGTTFDFNASLVGGTSPYTVTWSFGDGTTAVGTKVTHVYAQAGTYLVEVTAVDAAGGLVNTTFHDVHVGGASSPAAPLLGGGFGPSFLVGLVVGATVAAVAMFFAERRRRAGPAGPPSPYVPPQPIDRPGRP